MDHETDDSTNGDSKSRVKKESIDTEFSELEGKLKFDISNYFHTYGYLPSNANRFWTFINNVGDSKVIDGFDKSWLKIEVNSDSVIYRVESPDPNDNKKILIGLPKTNPCDLPPSDWGLINRIHIGWETHYNDNDYFRSFIDENRHLLYPQGTGKDMVSVIINYNRLTGNVGIIQCGDGGDRPTQGYLDSIIQDLKFDSEADVGFDSLLVEIQIYK